MTHAREQLQTLLHKLDVEEEAHRVIPAATPPGPHRRLCVVMATYDDFDGVWFTIQALRLSQPEAEQHISFVVLDNHPESRASTALKDLDKRVPHYRYVPFRGYHGTAVRDLAVREANADIVLCLDSHVLLKPGSIAALLAYFDDHPDSRDVLQGPLIWDELGSVMSSHFREEWNGPMYGVWELDSRATDPSGAPFDIPMQGLGMFAFRRDSWPGLNPKFRGFGGEEGYLHEKFRQAGGRSLCHPALGWAHRFERPSGVPYPIPWDSQIRNYRLGWAEIGWPVSTMEDQMRKVFTENPAIDQEHHLRYTLQQISTPLMAFTSILCLNMHGTLSNWRLAQSEFAKLDVDWLVERVFTPVNALDDECARAAIWRGMVATAQGRGYASVLLLADDVEFADDARASVESAARQIGAGAWDLWDPGPAIAPRVPTSDAGHPSRAIGINASVYGRILAAIPADWSELVVWAGQHHGIDGYVGSLLGDPGLRVLTSAQSGRIVLDERAEASPIGGSDGS